jgi:hypothetical protein
MKEQIKKTIAILLVVLFVVTLTASAVSAGPYHDGGIYPIGEDNFHKINDKVFIPIHVPHPDPALNTLMAIPSLQLATR